MAAGYTTLFCYIVYTIGHFIFMRRVCKTCMDGEKVYSIKILLAITLAFLTLGFAFLAAYQSIVVRAGMVLVIFSVVLVERRYIISGVKFILGRKK